MGRHGADGVRRQHAPAVLANELLLADRWGQPCRVYNVCIRPSRTEAAALSDLQSRALQLEPSLLRVPERALHASVACLLPVHQEFGRPKKNSGTGTARSGWAPWPTPRPRPAASA